MSRCRCKNPASAQVPSQRPSDGAAFRRSTDPDGLADSGDCPSPFACSARRSRPASSGPRLGSGRVTVFASTDPGLDDSLAARVGIKPQIRMNAVGAGLLGTMAGVAPCVDIGLTGSRARLAGAPVCRRLDRRPCSVDRTFPGAARAGKTLRDRRGGPKGRAHSQVRSAAGAEGLRSRGGALTSLGRAVKGRRLRYRPT